MKDSLKTLKKINHSYWCCSNKCDCNEINKDSTDLGNRIIQEMWDKELRYINYKNKENERK